MRSFYLVPILSRPEGPELHAKYRRDSIMPKFQSSPGPKARSYKRAGIAVVHEGEVPILSRPEGPELLVTCCKSSSIWRSSNPLQARRPGATLDGNDRPGLVLMFQSSPGPKARSYLICGYCCKYCYCSNPLQARRPGATSTSTIIPLAVPSSNPLQARRPGATL